MTLALSPRVESANVSGTDLRFSRNNEATIVDTASAPAPLSHLPSFSESVCAPFNRYEAVRRPLDKRTSPAQPLLPPINTLKPCTVDISGLILLLQQVQCRQRRFGEPLVSSTADPHTRRRSEDPRRRFSAAAASPPAASRAV